MGMVLDLRDFEKGMKKLTGEVMTDKGIGPGLFMAGNALLRDAIYQPKMAPMLKGDLRGSARTQDARGQLHELDEPTRQLVAGATKDEMFIAAGFNIEYAAKWHEVSPEMDARIQWTLPGSGRKFLESKMSMFRKKYGGIIADYIKQKLGGK